MLPKNCLQFICRSFQYILIILIIHISSTKDHAIFSRLVIDSLRALFVWLISLAAGWQCFQGVQLLGFITITLAALMYNDFLSGGPTLILNCLNLR